METNSRKTSEAAEGLSPQPWRLVGNRKRRKRRQEEDPGRGRDGKVECEGAQPAGNGMQVDSRQAGGPPQPGTEEGRWNVSGAWQGAQGRGWGWGRACEAGDKVATKSESWTAAEEVARESLRGQKLREQDGDEGGAPCPLHGTARQASRLRACVGNWEAPPRVKGPPLPSRRVPDN